MHGFRTQKCISLVKQTNKINGKEIAHTKNMHLSSSIYMEIKWNVSLPLDFKVKVKKNEIHNAE